MIAIITLAFTLESVIRGISKPTMILYFPGIYEYSTLMYILLTVYNYVMVVISFLTIPPGDMLFFVIFANISMVPRIIKEQLDELDDGIEKAKLSPVEIKRKLFKYLLMHQRYNE